MYGLFGLFIDAEVLAQMSVEDEKEIHIFKADCDGREIMKENCKIPKNMTCIGPNGNMYACGYVYGNKKYAMGHSLDKELDAFMRDEKIPRILPRGDAGKPRRCNGCPPLMKRMLEESAKHEQLAESRGNGKQE